MVIDTTIIDTTTVIVDNEYITTDTDKINDILEQISQYYADNPEKFH